MKKLLIWMTCLALLSGCGTPMTAKFDDLAFAAYTGDQGATVTGAGSFTNGKYTVSCRSVTLMPSTRYTDNIYAQFQDQGATDVFWWEIHGPNASRAIREGWCDTSGHFAFRSLPAGTWYVYAPVMMDQPEPCNPIMTARYYGCAPVNHKGHFFAGLAVKKVQTSPNSSVSVELSEKDFTRPL